MDSKQIGTPLASIRKKQGLSGGTESEKHDHRVDDNSFILPVDLIDVPPQPRTSFNDEDILNHITTLSHSIKTQSQLNPIVVRKNPDKPGRYILDAGECRLRAIRDVLGLKMIRSTLAMDIPGDQILNAMVRQLIDNNLRKDFRPIEKANGFLRLKKQSGWSNRKLADQLHVSEQMVGKYLSLLNAPKNIQDAIEKGSLAPSEWWNDKQSVLESFDTGPYSNAPRNQTTPKTKTSKTVKSKSNKISIDKDLALLILGVFKSLSPGVELESHEPGDLKSIKYALAMNAEFLSPNTKEDPENEIPQD